MLHSGGTEQEETVNVQRLPGPYRLFSFPGTRCLLQTFGTVTAGACGASCGAGACSFVPEVVCVSLLPGCSAVYLYLFGGWLGSCAHPAPLD